MRTLIWLIMSACSVLLVAVNPVHSDTITNADLPKLIAEAAKYQSGQSADPLWKIEQLLRYSIGKPALQVELEAGLVTLLAPSATFEARRFACHQLCHWHR